MKTSADLAGAHAGGIARSRAPDAQHAPAAARRAKPTIPGFTPRPEDAVAHRLRGAAPHWLALGAGALSALIYLGFVLAFPITRWWNHPHAGGKNGVDAINDMGRITGYSPIAASAFVLAILGLFFCQFLALTAANAATRPPTSPANARSQRSARLALLFFPLLFGSIMIWMQPVTTTDLYGYIARGYLYTHLHLNPMTHPAQFLPGGLSVNRPASPYGPAWLMITAVISWVCGENLLANMLLFKLVGFGSAALAMWLVNHLAQAITPERRLRVMALFAWSPLLIFESIGNGHNDIVMVVCVLAAFALMLRGRAQLAFGLLVLGALVKYISAIFVPLWLIYELRNFVPRAAADDATASPTLAPRDAMRGLLGRVRAAADTARRADQRAVFWLIARATVIGALLVAVFYAPFWEGVNTFTGLGQQVRPLYYNSSLVGFFSAPLQLLVPARDDVALDKTIRLVCYALFSLYTYAQIAWLWGRGSDVTLRHVITAAAKITCAVLLIITFWFQPWYVVWLLPLAALAEEPYVRRQGTILALGALLTYAVGNFLFVNSAATTNSADLLSNDFFVQFFEILLAFAPLLLLRASPFNQGWASIARRYLSLFGEGINRRPIFWERVTLALIIIVAALLRLVRLANLLQTVTIASDSGSAVLKEVSGDLRLIVTDTQGLNGVFSFVQNLSAQIFGPTVFAALLPSAIIGSLTVFALYLLTFEIMRRGSLPGAGTVALLAALLAATSRWHVSLSRSGVQVVLLPLLMCLGAYFLLLALRSNEDETANPAVVRAALSGAGVTALATASKRPPVRSRDRQQRIAATVRRTPRLRSTSATHGKEPMISRRRAVFYVACGVCVGLTCSLAPGLWLAPVIVAALLVGWRWRRPEGLAVSPFGLGLLSIAMFIAGAPALWQLLNPFIGYPVGSPFFARTSDTTTPFLSPLSLRFWQQVGQNAVGVFNLLRMQDYTASYPGSGGASIIPVLLLPWFLIGLFTILFRWRNFSALAFLLLMMLPLGSIIAVGAPTGVIEAATVLPAMCIIPALGLYETGKLLSHLPIVLDRINGVRVFSTPEQMGRILLLLFLVISTIRTFFWYFEATLPPQHKDFTPSYRGAPAIVQEQPSFPTPRLTLIIGEHGASGAAPLLIAR